MQIATKSKVPKIICGIAATIALISIGFFLLSSFWFWVSLEIISALLVAVGCSGEWWLHHHPAGREKKKKDEHHKLESRFIALVSVGVIMEFFALGHSIREGIKLEENLGQLESTNLVLRTNVAALELQVMEAKTNIANADPRNLPITSISGWARIVVKPATTNFAAILHLRPIYENAQIALTNADDVKSETRKVFCIFGRLDLPGKNPSAPLAGVPILGQITSMRFFEGATPELNGNVRFDVRFDSTGEGVPVWNGSGLSLNQFQSAQLWISNEWPPPRGIVGGQIDLWINGLWKKSFEILPQTNHDFPYRVTTTNSIASPYNF